MSKNNGDMPSYVRAVVSDEEKLQVAKQARALGITESQLIRKGLQKMGVPIEVEKDVGAPIGNKNNPGGNPHFGKEISGKKKKKRD